jgi:hypothetical protein
MYSTICSNCRYFSIDDGCPTEGWCRLNPPVLIPASHMKDIGAVPCEPRAWAQPAVYADDWCGKFKVK